MSIETQIESIRREIQINKIKPVEALSELNAIINGICKKLEDGSPESLMYDFLIEYTKLRESQTISCNSYGHNKQFFDAMIRIIGDLLIKIDEKITGKKT
jgi:hypothetical protein